MARVPYGTGPYSRISAFAPTFAGALDLPANLTGNLAPTVTFGPSPLASSVDLVGDMAPQAALGATLTGDWTIAGDMATNVAFAAEVTSGPLWGMDAVCPPPLWTTDTLCPPPPWKSDFNWRPSVYGAGGYGLGLYGFGSILGGYQPSAYGAAAYGAGPYGLGSVAGAVASPWVPSELCHA